MSVLAVNKASKTKKYAYQWENYRHIPSSNAVTDASKSVDVLKCTVRMLSCHIAGHISYVHFNKTKERRLICLHARGNQGKGGKKKSIAESISLCLSRLWLYLDEGNAFTWPHVKVKVKPDQAFGIWISLSILQHLQRYYTKGPQSEFLSHTHTSLCYLFFMYLFCPQDSNL